MLFTKKLYIILVLGFALFKTNAQSKFIQNESERLFQQKVSSLHKNYSLLGFNTYKGGLIKMERNTEFPIMVELIEGRWYQFLIVGDPETKKMEMKLGIEGVGDFITDKFKPQETNEFWTEFSFICPRSGRYLLTFFQKAAKNNPLAHISIMQRISTQANASVRFK